MLSAKCLMKQTMQVQLMRQLIGQLSGDSCVDAGCIRSVRLDDYNSRQLALAEWQTFYSQEPMLVGLVSDLNVVGSVITNCHFGVHVVVTRNHIGELEAFRNRCSPGDSNPVRCSSGAPEPAELHQQDLDLNNLQTLPCVEKYGMVWVHPLVDGSLNVDALLSGLEQELASWQLDKFVFRDQKTIKANCNWKLAIDSYGESYHLKTLHKNSMATEFVGNVACYEALGENSRLVLCRQGIERFLQLSEPQWNIRRCTLIIYYLFPNTQLIIGEDGVHLINIYPAPDDPTRSITDHSFYIDPLLAHVPDRTIQQGLQAFRNVIEEEDYPCMETIQRAANAMPMGRVIFGRNEPALHHYHCNYARRLNRGGPQIEG